MQDRRRRLALATTVSAAVLAAVGVTAVSAQAATGCRVNYAVVNQWQGGFGANVVVDNLGDPINGWRLTWSFASGQAVTQLWNGSVSQSGEQVTVTNAAWNGSIPSGGSASFGMGYRFGIFNYATQSLGGSVTVPQLSLTTP